MIEGDTVKGDTVKGDRPRLLKYCDLTYNQFQLSAELSSNDLLSLTLVDLNDLDAYELRLSSAEAEACSSPERHFASSVELYDFLDRNSSFVVIDQGRIIVTSDRTAATELFSLCLEKKPSPCKFQELWLQFLQLKRTLSQQLDQNTKRDLNTYKELKADLELQRRTDGETLARIDALDRKFTAATDKLNSEVKFKFESQEKKTKQFITDNEAVVEELKNKIRAVEGKSDDLKKATETSLSELSADSKKKNFKLIDLESSINKLSASTHDRFEHCESTDAELRANLLALSASNTAEIESLKQRVTELQLKENEVANTTVIIRDFRDNLEKYNRETKAKITLLQKGSNSFKEEIEKIKTDTKAKFEKIQSSKEANEAAERSDKAVKAIQKANNDILERVNRLQEANCEVERAVSECKTTNDSLEASNSSLALKLQTITQEFNEKTQDLQIIVEELRRAIDAAGSETKRMIEAGNMHIIRMVQEIDVEVKASFETLQAASDNIKETFETADSDAKLRWSAYSSEVAFLKDQLGKLNLTINVLNEAASAAGSKAEKAESAIHSIQQENDRQNAAIDALQHTVDEVREGKEKSLSIFGSHPRNPHKDHFSWVKSSASSIFVRHVAENGYFSFVNKFEIRPETQAAYRVRLKRVTLRNLYIGLGTSAVFGSDEGAGEETVYYYCGNGVVSGGGSSLRSGVLSETGDEVSVAADLGRGKIVWRRNAGQFCESDVPETMRGKPLFLLIRNYYEDDEVELQSEP